MTEEEDDEEYDDPKIVKSRMSGFSRGKLEAGYVQLESSPKVVSVCFQGLARRSRGVKRRFVPGSLEISLVSSLHRASTDALMIIFDSNSNTHCNIELLYSSF